jgi:hypothetical protein
MVFYFIMHVSLLEPNIEEEIGKAIAKDPHPLKLMLCIAFGVVAERFFELLDTQHRNESLRHEPMEQRRLTPPCGLYVFLILPLISFYLGFGRVA